MYRLHPMRGLAALVAVVCVCGCEAAKSANPAAPSAIEQSKRSGEQRAACRHVVSQDRRARGDGACRAG